MILIQDKLVSNDLLEKEFVCNLKKCKGACCVEGDEGAPVAPHERKLLEEVYPKIKHRMRPEGIAAIEEQGTYTQNDKGEFLTTLVNDKECAYVVFDENQVALCAIESAYLEGDLDWKKPVSCHLYPIRVNNIGDFEAVNYDKWEICDPACSLGTELGVSVYEFLKVPLIRKFGEAFYYELDAVAKDMKK